MTIHELFQKVFQAHWSRPQYRATGWDREVRGYYNRQIKPALGLLQLEEVTPKIVRNWHLTLEETPTAANRALGILSKLFTWAEEEEIRPQHSNPCVLVKNFRAKRRSRYATEDELKRLGEVLASRQKKKPRLVAFVKMLAMTGARPESLGRVRWDQIRDGVLYFSGKTSQVTGEEERVAVPAGVLKDVPLRRDGLIFGPVAYQRFWEEVTKEAGVEGLWLRDLRRTYATIGMSQGIGMDVIGELLNHRSTATTKRYAKVVPTLRMQAAVKIGTKIALLLG